MKLTHLLSVMLLATFIVACGPPEPGTSSNSEPSWMGVDGGDDAMYASGSALATSREGAVTGATTISLNKISQQLESEVQSVVEDFNSEYNQRTGGQIQMEGLGLTERATRVISNQNVSGYKVENREVRRYGPTEYEAFIRLKLPTSASAAMKNDAMKNAMADDDKLYIEFKKSQAFERLDKQMKEQDK